MFDATSRSDLQAPQRAVGSLRVAFKTRDGATVLDRLYQQGCLKARLPAREKGAWPVVVTLNSSGGVAGGDHLEQRFTFAPGTRATITAQAAERFYRADPVTGAAVLRGTVELGHDACAEWMPQETILFDRFALDRRLDVSLSGNARFLGIEMLVFGRRAMGETVHTGWLRDVINIRRDGRSIWHESIRLDGPVATILARKAVANGACAIATILYATPDAGSYLPRVRELCDLACHDGAEAGCSAVDDVLVARVLAQDGFSLRQRVINILNPARDGRPLPRVWLC